MLDDVFGRSHVCRRLRGGPLGTVLEDLSSHLSDRGLARGTIQQYLQAAEHFTAWLHRQRTLPREISEESVQLFLKSHIPRCRCRNHCPTYLINLRTALRHLLKMLRQRGELPTKNPAKDVPIEATLDRYQKHLSETCGLAETTINRRTCVVREFLNRVFGKRPLRLERIRRQELFTFVADYGRCHKPGSTKVITCSLRSFLRYLQFCGQADASLVGAVPTIPQWTLDRLPRVMNDEQLASFFNCFDRSTLSGRRDFAMALCLAELGLRAHEVISVRLEDIDWRRSTLKISAGKSRRERLLPLTHRVGRAIASYIRYGRPATSAQTLFVRHSAPRGMPLNTEQVRGAMRRAYAKVAGCERWTGTHVLRHTAATRLHRRGVSLKEVADILGHQSLDTTAIYTKIDLTSLSAVALPWPEVRS